MNYADTPGGLRGDEDLGEYVANIDKSLEFVHTQREIDMGANRAALPKPPWYAPPKSHNMGR